VAWSFGGLHGAKEEGKRGKLYQRLGSLVMLIIFDSCADENFAVLPANNLTAFCWV